MYNKVEICSPFFIDLGGFLCTSSGLKEIIISNCVSTLTVEKYVAWYYVYIKICL